MRWLDVGRMVFLQAVLTGAACSPRGDVYHCGALSCDNLVMLSAPLQVDPNDVPALEIAIFRNGVGVLSHPVWQPESADFECSTYGPLLTSCTIRPAQDGTADFMLELAYLGRVDDFQNGDSYSVRVGQPGQPAILNIDKVLSYTESRPNGPNCDPRCKTAHL